MNRKTRGLDAAGFGKVELLAIIATVALIAGILLPEGISSARRKSGRIQCVNNLKQVGLAYRIFASVNLNRFPGEVMLSNGVEAASINVPTLYGSLGNILSTPKILMCPEDKWRSEAPNSTQIPLRNISYFASLSAKETLPRTFLAGDRNMATNGVAVGSGLLALTTNAAASWTKEMHFEEGNILMGDGSVQQMSSNRLRDAMADQGIGTNWLVMP